MPKEIFVQINGETESTIIEIPDATKFLAELRTLLTTQRIMTGKDRFMVRGGVVHESIESKKTIDSSFEPAEKAADEKPHTESEIPKIKIFKPGAGERTIPDFDNDRRAPDPKEQDLPDPEEDQVSKRTGRGTGAESTEHFDDYNALKMGERANLFDHVGLGRGILYKNGAVTWSFRRCIPLGEVSPVEANASPEPTFPAKVLARFPQESYVSNELFTFDKREHDIRKMVSGSLSGGYGGLGFGVNIEASGAISKREISSETVIYGYSEIIIPKVELRLALSFDPVVDAGYETKLFRANVTTKAALTKNNFDGEFADIVTEFKNSAGNTYDDFRRLRALFEDWGAYLPLEFIVGGKLFATDTTTIKSHAEATAWQASFRLAVKTLATKTNIEVKTESESKAASSSQSKTAMLQTVGGDPGTVLDPAKWAASLGPYVRWRRCRVADLVPIYAFVPATAQRGILNTLLYWQDYWRENELMLDFDSFLVPLAERLERYQLT